MKRPAPCPQPAPSGTRRQGRGPQGPPIPRWKRASALPRAARNSRGRELRARGRELRARGRPSRTCPPRVPLQPAAAGGQHRGLPGQQRVPRLVLHPVVLAALVVVRPRQGGAVPVQSLWPVSGPCGETEGRGGCRGNGAGGGGSSAGAACWETVWRGLEVRPVLLHSAARSPKGTETVDTRKRVHACSQQRYS